MMKLMISYLPRFARNGWPLLCVSIFVYFWIAFQSFHGSRPDGKTKRGLKVSNRKWKEANLPEEQPRCSCDLADSKNTRFYPHFDGFGGLRSEGADMPDDIEYFNTLLSLRELNLQQTEADRNESKLVSHTGNGLYYDMPVNKHEYDYIHNPESLCDHSQGKDVILMVIISSPENEEMRNIIRRTYGNDNRWRGLLKHKSIVKSVFFLGKPKKTTLQENIDSESDHYGDIVQENFVDCHANQTKKIVMALKWVANNCSHAKYVIKCDDTSMILQPKFQLALNIAPTTGWAAGRVLDNPLVSRDIESENYISEYFYPLMNYPSYLHGGAYILTTDVALAIYNVTITTPVFPLEDVFVGMCLEKLSITLYSIENFLKCATIDWMQDFGSNSFTRQSVKQFAVVSYLDKEYMNSIWDFTHFQ